jgi:thiol-disulfide isomerase/thioredoxin
MKHNRTLLCSLLLAALLGAAGCASKTAHVSCDTAPMLAWVDDGAVVDSAVVQRLMPNGEYETFDKAEVTENTVTWSGKIAEPFIGRIKCSVTTPASKGDVWSVLLFEPGSLSSDDAAYYHGAKYNDAIVDVSEKIKQCGDDADAIRKVFDSFIRNNPDAVTKMMLLRAGAKTDPERWLEVYESMTDDVRNDPFIKDMAQQKNAYLEIMRAREAIVIGDSYTDFEGTWDDREYRLSDYVGKGKYVLIDFWASWCGPCREEIPNIIEAYNKYGKKGLEVLGVAIKDNPDNTVQAVKDLHINYTVFHDKDDSAFKAYRLMEIPRIILIGPDGTILENNLRGEGIEDAVKKYLN